MGINSEETHSDNHYLRIGLKNYFARMKVDTERLSFRLKFFKSCLKLGLVLQD